MSRYAGTHENTQGPGDARPTAFQIIEDEGLVDKLPDKVVLITGASSGIGVETARALYATGAKVFMTVRNKKRGEEVVESIKASHPSSKGSLHLINMELDSLATVHAGAAEFLKQSDQLNILITNAGVMATPEGKTADGFETQFGTNHLSHFLLFQLLKPTLLASSTPDFQSRVVVVTSYAHRTGGIRFDDFNFEKPNSYDPWLAYGQSKTANLYMSNEIERRYGSKGLHSTSLHPGGIATNLQAHLPKEATAAWAKNQEIVNYMKSPEQGAATSVYAAVGKEWEGRGGKYLSNCVVQEPQRDSTDPMATGDDGYASYAYDEEKEKKLWAESLKMLGLDDDQ